MKRIITKITSLLLAFLVLFSTFSFTVATHYCGDFIIAISFTGETEVCEDDMIDELSIKMKDCCSEEIQKIEGQDELQVNSSEKFDFKKQQFVTAFFISYKDVFVKTENNKWVYTDFSPPDILFNHQVSYQSFLI
ncbi:hypothetical protein [uncultured Polaribacter sp.]|uniref:HYC_CC_PP family protein n=1 Tax=uncultured Polaribacter sp. TaxID=174711 RepID=UPI0026181B8D|nr:hypothetical protein [uncultured Polaribacter sp.]